jgi:thiamine-phosphate pyrophosphorylase
MRPPFNLRLYLVLDPRRCGGRDQTLATLQSALNGGVTMVQLHARETPKREVYTLTSDLLPMTRAHKVPLLLNSHLDVAMACGVDGVHLGQRDMAPEVARRVLGEEHLIGLTVSNAHEVETANRLADTGVIDYLSLWPVHPSSSSSGAEEKGEVPDLSTHLPIHYPTCASGGITAENVGELLQGELAKVSGVAVRRAICEAKDPEEAARALLRAMEAQSG